LKALGWANGWSLPWNWSWPSDRKFEGVVKSAEQAAVLVLVY
jgi:hypothetical protein